MTTEDDFQAALDACPDDWQTRIVLADWLEDRSDPRAEGFRALGMLRKVPLIGRDRRATWLREMGADIGFVGPSYLPLDWHELGGAWIWYDSRREAEDAAARTFVCLPPERRAELLDRQHTPGGNGTPPGRAVSTPTHDQSVSVIGATTSN